MSSKVSDGALAHARRHGARRIFCGHTHAAMYRAQDGVEYYNSGSWIDERPTYITVGEDGVRIREYDGEIEPHQVAGEVEQEELVGVNSTKDETQQAATFEEFRQRTGTYENHALFDVARILETCYEGSRSLEEKVGVRA